MNPLEAEKQIGESRTYEIVVRGEAGPALRAAFEDSLNLLVTVRRGTTVLRGPFTDQAAVHGVLTLIQTLGLHLIDVHLVMDVTNGT